MSHNLSFSAPQVIEVWSSEHSRMKMFHWKWEAKFCSQYLFVGLYSEAEILQDLNLHNSVCIKKRKFWFGPLLEGLFHILERNYVQRNARFWEQKFLLLLLLIKKYMQIPWTYQKVCLLYSKMPLWNKIFWQKSAQIKRIKSCT